MQRRIDPRAHAQNVICPMYGISYIVSALDKTFCHVYRHITAFSIPRLRSDIRKAISFFPRSFQNPFLCCKILQHFWIHPVVKVVVIFVLLDQFQCLLAVCFPIRMHVIGFPLCRVLVTIRNKATIIPVLVNMFPTKQQFTRCYLVLLVLQLQVL